MEGLHILSFKVDFNDMVRRYPGIKKMLFEKVEKQITFPTTPYSSKNLDEIIVFCGYKVVQKIRAGNLHGKMSCIVFLNLYKKFKHNVLYHTAVGVTMGKYNYKILMALAAGAHSTDEIAAHYNVKANHTYQIKFRVKNALAHTFAKANYRLVA